MRHYKKIRYNTKKVCFVDLISIVITVNELSDTSSGLSKRDLILADDSNCKINCVLWGRQVLI